MVFRVRLRDASQTARLASLFQTTQIALGPPPFADCRRNGRSRTPLPGTRFFHLETGADDIVHGHQRGDPWLLAAGIAARSSLALALGGIRPLRRKTKVEALSSAGALMSRDYPQMTSWRV